MSKPELSARDLRQLIKEAQKVQRGEANAILIMKSTKGKGLFVKAGQFDFSVETIQSQ